MPGLYYMELLRAGDAAEWAGAVLQKLALDEGSGPILYYSSDTVLIQCNDNSLTEVPACLKVEISPGLQTIYGEEREYSSNAFEARDQHEINRAATATLADSTLAMAFRRQVKNFVKNYSEAEIKVREATSNDPWGPSSSLMLAISDMTFNTASLSEIMHMMWQRLGDHGKNWRHVYKCLSLMDYLIKNGSKKVIQCCREGLCNLQMLKDFQHIDEAGKDQGRYIREKSKQVITLLMDEQLLFKEREVASWTRHRTSYCMMFPTRLPAPGNSPAACASVFIPENLPSEKKHSLLTIASLHNKKNTSKARLRLEQCQDVPSPAEPSLSKDSPLLRMKTWKSTEDLTLLHDEYPNQLLPAIPPPITSPTFWMSEGEAEVCNLWDADAMSIPSEKRPSMQTNMGLFKRLEETITNTTTGSPPQTPQEKQTSVESFETLAPSQAFRPSGKDEFVSLGLRMSKSEFMFHNQSSVETLYVSPSFRTVSPEKETRASEDVQTPVQSKICWMEEDVSLKPLAMRGEVRGAVLRLHEDLSLVIQELGVINSHLGNLSGSSQAASKTLQDPQSSMGSSDPV
ncbi:ENTH domain-containing protein 1 [Microtus ochrogaster]|uniref:ENTH domain-containing protein 1 n=1 Tax=Microtus ochrogaster TaxID=79684 RepID=A0A8J6GXP4_MICOH|nr:ENTH domain-containing protein 1 [Microtus ochrogaster]